MQIAICGKARSGKDSTMNIINNEYLITQIRFADPVYQIHNYIQEIVKINQYKDPKLLQFIGDGLRGIINKDIWIDLALKNINLNNNNVVVDMRYKNEYYALKKLGFITLRIIRPEYIIDRDKDHISECDLDNIICDYTIHNDGTLLQLNNRVIKLLKKIYPDI